MTLIKEPRAPARGRTRYLELVRKGARHLGQTRALRLLVFDKVVVHAFLFFIVWLYQPLLQELGVAIIMFGVVHSGLAGVQMLVMRKYSLLESVFRGKKRYLVGSALISGGSLILLGFVMWVPLALVLMLVAAAFGITRAPLLSNYINKYVESDNRATVLSLVSMTDRLFFAVLYPIVGLIVDWSLRAGFVAVGIMAIAAALASRVREEHLLD